MAQKPTGPKKKQMTIKLPEDLEAVYANMALITHTPVEIVLDFAQILPRMPAGNGQVKSRVIMTPVHAKLLLRALTQNIANYEAQFGEIKVPNTPSLADQLFRFPPPNNEDDDDKS
ncbi:MAG TPA: DUF3467 domain-containing protein [Anaerolineae bacterium]|nr:DUF3467 domain-containing protein [Anaerolineae bacterium]